MTYKDFFDPQLLEDAWDKYTKEDNYAVLCRMPPTLFSSLAEQRLFPGAMEDLPKPDKGGIHCLLLLLVTVDMIL
jgi:hypothetical protein